MDHPRELTVDARASWDRPVVSVPVLICLSLVGGQLPSFSAQANLYSFGTGGVLIWIGLSNRVPRRPAPRRLAPGALWWLLPAIVFGIFEGTTFVLSVGDDFPTFSRLADPLLEDHVVRSAAWFAWLAAFWGMVRR
ncbi:hypothetical protein [Micromonospora auratinigra]|uniref:Uncharacterized protein n=1 Tax=Micromonospora auratinigra TaxID=261654 RepID=A0A1A9AB23_9ACTN|nr:hypothetical protein [Micromonospora auratinigra]SBT53353.1 hypothetical protein GA0070611_6079 [Micromonospora auratinigra]